MDLLLIDNYDSFTFNIVQAYQRLGASIDVARNNRIEPEEILARRPRLLIIGPGPGNPQGAGISKVCVLIGLPVFGICLGHQAIAEAFGATIVRAPQAMHGKVSSIYHNCKGVFSGLPQGFFAVRYHSLIIYKGSLPASLEVTAWTQEGEIMGIRHKELRIEGVQFHPESVASQAGIDLLRNSLLL
jgi:anthranilate synthase component 2